MKTYKCKQCNTKWESGTQIRQWVYSFCSKSCRLKFNQEKARKEKDKIKEKKVKVRIKKQNSVSYLKKKLWEKVSLYIRLRDSDDDNFCVCCTCGIRKHYKDNIQAGHYVPSGSSSFHRYNEKNIHSQCGMCNVVRWWNLIEYRPFMIKKYGLEYTEWLYETRNEIIKLWSMELKELIDHYTIKLNQIKSNKCLD